jgi:tetratricopeptide (TPR) repeat protein
MREWSDEQLKDALREGLRTRWKARLREQEAGLGRRRTLKRLPTWAWAAALAALVAVSLWLFLPSPSVPSSQLFATYFEPLPNVLIPEIRGEGDENKLDQALRQYSTGDYSAALAAFDQVELAEQTAGYFLYRGITELALEKGEAAQISLEQATDDSFRFSQQWYLSLAYLQQEQLDQARQLLALIQADQQHPFREQASELLLEMP